MRPVIEAGNLKSLEKIRHGFFTRQGGVSKGIYQSLNCGFGSNDDPAHVGENRVRVAQHLGFSREALVTAYQTHSATALGVSAPWIPKDAPKADALVTATPGIALGVLTADCTPVLFAESENQIIGVAHAGWRGALAGILEATLDAMEDLGAKRDSIQAAIGPSIGPGSYEVGPEFPAPFTARDLEAAAFFRPGQPGTREGHSLFDLPGYVAWRLEKAGVAAETAGHDTCREEALFFSNRRAFRQGEADFGRQISAIGLIGGLTGLTRP